MTPPDIEEMCNKIKKVLKTNYMDDVDHICKEENSE